MRPCNPFEKAKALAHDNGDAVNELLAGLQRGWVLFHLGDYAEASRVFSEVETPLEKAGYRVHQVNCALGLVNADIALGDLSSAGRRLDELSSKLPRQHMVSDLLYRISVGRYCTAKGDLPSACRAFTSAGALARSRGYRPFDFEAHLALAQCLLASGQMEEARRVLRRLVGLNERLKYRLLAALAPYGHGGSRGGRGKGLGAQASLAQCSGPPCSSFPATLRIGDLRGHFLNRPDSRALLQRSENVEDILYLGFAPAPETPRAANVLESIARINEQLHRRDSLKSTLALIVDEALRFSGAERGIIFLSIPPAAKS